MGGIATIAYSSGKKTTPASVVWINSSTAVLGIYQDGNIVINVKSTKYDLILLQYSRTNIIFFEAANPTNKTNQFYFDQNKKLHIVAGGSVFFKISPNGENWGDGTKFQLAAKGGKGAPMYFICKVHPLPGQAP